MPRFYSALLIAILAAGGWFFTKGPGAGNFDKIISAYAPSQAGQGQAAPGYAPTYPAARPVAQSPANYGTQPAPAPAAQSPVPGDQTLRVASFNIQVFGNAKAAKPHVMWTLAAIIQNFQLVAIQEIRTQDDYFIDNFLRDYVNTNGRVYDSVVGPRLGRSRSTEQYAFVFDTAAIEVNRNYVYTVNDPDDLLHRPPLVAMFRARGPPPQEAFTFILVNIHTSPSEAKEEVDALAQVYQAVRRAADGEDDIIILGDLNVDDKNLGELGRLQGIRPVVRDVFTNTRQTKLYDNIILHQPSTAEFTGRWGVVNFEQVFGLTREQALQVSDHFPVWAEFSVYEAVTPGRVATRDNTTTHTQ